MKDVARTADGFRTWAGSRQTRSAELARLIATALVDPKASPAWGHIDVRAEADALREDRTPLSLRIGRAVVMPLYIVPVLVTWLHLRSAVKGYAQFGSTQEPNANLDFLSFWAGGYDGAFSGTTLQSTGLQVVGIVGVIFLVQLFISVSEELSTTSEQIPDDLLLEAQLHFASRKVLTPQDIAEKMSEAARLLEEAIVNITDRVRDAGELVVLIGKSIEEMNSASEKLSLVAIKMDETIAPMTQVGEALMSADAAIRRSSGALDNAGDKVSDLSDGLVVITNAAGDVAAGIKGIIPETKLLLDSVSHAVTLVDRVQTLVRDMGNTTDDTFTSGLREATTILVREMGNAGRALSELMEASGRTLVDASSEGAARIRSASTGVGDDLDRLVGGADAVARKLETLSETIGDNVPVVDRMSVLALDMDQVVKNIQNAVSEIKRAAEIYRDVNDDLQTNEPVADYRPDRNR